MYSGIEFALRGNLNLLAVRNGYPPKRVVNRILYTTKRKGESDCRGKFGAVVYHRCGLALLSQSQPIAVAVAAITTQTAVHTKYYQRGIDSPAIR